MFSKKLLATSGLPFSNIPSYVPDGSGTPFFISVDRNPNKIMLVVPFYDKSHLVNNFESADFDVCIWMNQTPVFSASEIEELNSLVPENLDIDDEEAVSGLNEFLAIITEKEGGAFEHRTESYYGEDLYYGDNSNVAILNGKPINILFNNSSWDSNEYNFFVYWNFTEVLNNVDSNIYSYNESPLKIPNSYLSVWYVLNDGIHLKAKVFENQIKDIILFL